MYGQIGARIAEFRQSQRAMSQEALARSIGLSRASVINIEKGRHRVQIHTLYEIARALGVSPFEFLPKPSAVSTGGKLPDSLAKQLKPEEQPKVRELLSLRGGTDDKR